MPMKNHVSVGGYYGGKAEMLKVLLPQFETPHVIFVDVFCGGGSVILNKPPAKIEVMNDASETVITFWRTLRERPQELMRAIDRTPPGEAALNEIKNAPPTKDEVEIARRFYCGTQITMLNTPGRGSAGVVTAVQYCSNRKKARLAKVVRRLRDVQIWNTDACRIIKRMAGAAQRRLVGNVPDMPGQVLFYLDPPYAADTRGTSCNDYLVDYGKETSAEFHSRLLDCVLEHAAQGFKFCISGYHNREYDRRLAEFHCVEYSKAVTAASKKGKRGKARRAVECVWRNYPVGAEGMLL